MFAAGCYKGEYADWTTATRIPDSTPPCQGAPVDSAAQAALIQSLPAAVPQRATRK